MKLWLEGTDVEPRLETFLAVCREMNYTRAAEALHITQPAVSHQIRALETEYGAPLFLFEGKKIRLSPAGQLLRESAIAQRHDEEVLRRRMQATVSGRKLLRLGATRTIGDYAMADVLAAHVRCHPQTELHLMVDNTAVLLEQLDKGRLECALIEGMFDTATYDSACLRTEPFVPVCAARHVFVREPQTLADMLPQRLLLRERGSGTRMLLETALSAERLRLRDFALITQLGSMKVILSWLEQDMGVSFLYRVAARPLIDNGTLRELSLAGFPVMHDFALVWPRGSQNAEEYRALCRQWRDAEE